MKQTDERYQQYIKVLKEELVAAMGCTEPVSIAYAAARARELLGAEPRHVLIEASGNIIKNVKSVTVPHTGGMKGIEAAAAAGIAAGDASRGLQVIASIAESSLPQIKAYLERSDIQVRRLESADVLDLIVRVRHGEEEAAVRISGAHDHIVWEMKNGDVLLRREKPRQEEAPLIDRSFMSVEGILDFADSVGLDEVSDVLQRQIRCNMAIANEGLKQGYGANIGRVLLDMRGDDLHTRVRAYAAAGSDARMSGCGLPVIINSGSGNQGITASVPLVVWGRAHQAGRELLYRSLIVSNLITIHLKNGIGKLSAYCGVISAGCGAACGICYQDGGDLEAVSHTLVNALAVNSGVVCDGAKPSCAAKIASAIEAGLLGYEMYRHGSQFRGGEGIVSKGVENTIRNISRLAREGMQQTDREIIEIMTGCC